MFPGGGYSETMANDESLPHDHDTFWCDRCGSYHGELSSECDYDPYEDMDEDSEDELDDLLPVVMQIVGLINGGKSAFDGQYVVEYDPGRDGVEPGTGRPMLCHLVTTPRVQDATRFTSSDAFELWRAVDPRQPVRPDGKPNRPFTAFTVSIQPPSAPPITDVLDPKGRI